MVESLYAVLADGAVPTPASPDSLTVRAELAGINVIKQFAEIHILVFQVAWLRTRCFEEKGVAEQRNYNIRPNGPLG